MAKYKRSFSNNCKVCSVGFVGRNNQIYCSKICQEKIYKYQSEFKNIPTGTVGAIQELRVGIDLLGRGYEVFRALSPSCSCDLLAKKDGNEITIEVRTGYLRHNGKLTYPNIGIRASVLAVVLPGGEIVYNPKI